MSELGDFQELYIHPTHILAPFKKLSSCPKDRDKEKQQITSLSVKGFRQIVRGFRQREKTIVSKVKSNSMFPDISKFCRI